MHSKPRVVSALPSVMPVRVPPGSTPLGVLARFFRRQLQLVDEDYARSFAAAPSPATPLAAIVPPVVGQGVLITSWTKFDMYACDFGWGRAANVSTGYGPKPRFVSGCVVFQRSPEGDGGVDVIVYVPQRALDALKVDPHFRLLQISQ
eukprot:jgi/Mesen1/8642/ME000500S08113